MPNNPPENDQEKPESETPSTWSADTEDTILLGSDQASASPWSDTHGSAEETLAGLAPRDAASEGDTHSARDERSPHPDEAPASSGAHHEAATEGDENAELGGGSARLKVVGVGGAGCNISNYMIESGMPGIDFIAVNTDRQALRRSLASTRIAIGEDLTRGMGAGGDPSIGQRAAQESYQRLVTTLDGADMVVLLAGMGGGTGTGASPIIAQAAREVGALTLALVTTPFAFERRRRLLADQGVAALRTIVDAIIIAPNERLAQFVDKNTGMFEAYRMVNETLREGMRGLSDLLTEPGLINLDFADVRAIMTDAGSAYLATGVASGENRADEALRKALSNALLNVDITGARGLIFNLTGGDDLTLREVEHISDALSVSIHPEANLIFGATYDETLNGALKLTLIATGFEPRVAPEARPSTWTPGRISMTPGPRDERGRQPRQPAPPGRMMFNEPLPQLSPPDETAIWNRPSMLPGGPLPSGYPEQPGQPGRPGGPPSQVGGGAPIPPTPPAGRSVDEQQTQQLGQQQRQSSERPRDTRTSQGPATSSPDKAGERPNASSPDSPRDVVTQAGPASQYPQEEYAENTEDQLLPPDDDHQGFWSRLFTSNP